MPDNDLTIEFKVTLNGLLSCTAGLTVGGFNGYKIDEEIPTTIQILEGNDPDNPDSNNPANSAPIGVVTIPGTEFSYSGGG